MQNEKDLSWIESVKEQTNDGTVSGYLVNGSLSIPIADSNRHYEYLKVWLEDNTPESEFTDEEIAQQELDKQIAEAKAYLASTDFYFTVDKYATLSEERKLELATLRAEARVLINSLEG